MFKSIRGMGWDGILVQFKVDDKYKRTKECRAGAHNM